MDLAGTETLLMSYYKQIDRNQVQFDFAVSATNECAYDKEIVQMGGRIFRYPKYTITNHFTYTLWWRNFLIEHPEIRIIHGHIGSTAAIYLRIAKQQGRIAIAHSHSTWGDSGPHAWAYRIFSFPTRYIADYYFGCSRQALIDRYGKKVANNKEIASVMPNAIDARKFVYNEAVRNEVRAQYNIPANMLVIGTVGRFSPQKNPLFTVSLSAELKRRGLDFRFLWFGQGEMESAIREEMSKQNVEDKIILAGVRKDIYRVLQAMDVFVFPSVWEGLGISCIEAQAAGLPALCSESVPDDAKVTDLFHYLPLNDVKTWADEVLEQKGVKRTDRFDEIDKAGYDIVSAAKRMQDFYLGI